MVLKNNNNSIFMKIDGFDLNSEESIKNTIVEAIGELEHFGFDSQYKSYEFTPIDSYTYDIFIDNDINYISIELGIGGVFDMITDGGIEHLKDLISIANYSGEKCISGALLHIEGTEKPKDYNIIIMYRVISSDIRNKLGFQSHLKRSINGINQYLKLTMDKVYESK